MFVGVRVGVGVQELKLRGKFLQFAEVIIVRALNLRFSFQKVPLQRETYPIKSRFLRSHKSYKNVPQNVEVFGTSFVHMHHWNC